MTPEEWKRVQALFDAALQRDPEERDEFLERACADRPSLRAAVASLLAAHDVKGNFTEAPALETMAELDAHGEPRPGWTVGPYIIRHEIGRGGMGVVYLADDTRLARRVALKALAPGVGREIGVRQRLRQEARAAAALSHPGIATVYALEEIDQELYLACEYVPGQTLRVLLARGPLPPSHVVDIATQLARALASAHAQGVVHRDLKPENVILTPAGVVKVLDFGLARVESLTPTRLTQTGTIVGTPAYMAPEQAEGLDVNFCTDQFAFGVLLYEMASGSNPFDAKTATATIARILNLEPAALSAVCPAAAPELDEIVATCLRKQPTDRYRSTQQLVADLERLQTRMSEEPDRTASRPRRNEGERERGPEALTPRGVRTWWRTHQVAIIALYVIATARSWQIKEWLHEAIPLWVFLALGFGSMIGGTMRGHLMFTEVFNSARLGEERRRTRTVIVAVDLLMAAALSADALLLAPKEPLSAVLTMSLALGITLATVLMEPATTAAAFGGDRTPPK